MKSFSFLKKLEHEISFSTIKTLIFLHTWCLFWHPHCFKRSLLGLSNFPHCLSYHAFQWPLDWKIYKIQTIFKLNAHNVPYIIIGVLQHGIQHAQLSKSWCSLLPQKRKKKHVQLNAFSVFNMPFQQPCYFLLLFWSFVVIIFVFLLFPIFRHLWVLFGCVFVVDQT
jgi:hypothetical protein